MNVEELAALAEKVEGCAEHEQRGMLELAFIAIHGPKPRRVQGGSDDWRDWLAIHNPFYQMLNVNAFESAAMTLIPDGMAFYVDSGTLDDAGCHACVRSKVNRKLAGGCKDSATPALALTAAALRARAHIEEKNCG